MIRNAFDLSFHRVSGGDMSYLDRFCELLADRRVFVPVVSLRSIKNKDDPGYLQFALFMRNSKPTIPIFTYEAMANFWISRVRLKCECVSLRGADLAARIDENISVVINLGQIQIVELPSAALERMAQKQSILEGHTDEFDMLEIEVLGKIKTVSMKKKPIVSLIDSSSGDSVSENDHEQSHDGAEESQVS